MNAASKILETLADNGVEVCFANPGTSEMHFVSALDREERIDCVLCLAETVATGAADGYARIAGKPALTLLHTGPGLANGLSNMHNARRGPVPMVNIVGDHADYHLALDAPLTSDVAGLAKPMSHHVERYTAPSTVADQSRKAMQIAMTEAGRVVTMILPADVAWQDVAEDGPNPVQSAEAPAAHTTAAKMLDDGCKALASGPETMLLIGGNLDANRMERCARIAAATGVRLATEVFPTRLAHGAGRPIMERMPYLPEAMHSFMTDVRHLVLLGSAAPVTFFAYPSVKSEVVPEGCSVHVLADADDCIDAALDALEAKLGCADSEITVYPPRTTGSDAVGRAPDAALDAFTLAETLAMFLPPESILVDESLTGGAGLFPALAGAAPHDWILTNGGSIGWALPAAVGAAVAAPDRRVVCVVGDGSSLYSIQALWSMAREGLDITVIILANREYAILKAEYARMKAIKMGERARSMMSLGDPDVGFVALAQGFGVEGTTVSTTEALAEALTRSFATSGPYLVEAVLPVSS